MGVQHFGCDKVYLLMGGSHIDEKYTSSYLEKIEGNIQKPKEIIRVDEKNFGDIYLKVQNIFDQNDDAEFFINISTSSKLFAVAILFSTWDYDFKTHPTIFYIAASHYPYIKLIDLNPTVDSLLENFEDEIKNNNGRRIKKLLKELKNDILNPVIKDGFAIVDDESFMEQILEIPYLHTSFKSRVFNENKKKFLSFIYKNAPFDSYKQLIEGFLNPKDKDDVERENIIRKGYQKFRVYFKTLEDFKIIKSDDDGIFKKIMLTDFGRQICKDLIIETERQELIEIDREFPELIEGGEMK